MTDQSDHVVLPRAAVEEEPAVRRKKWLCSCGAEACVPVGQRIRRNRQQCGMFIAADAAEEGE